MPRDISCADLTACLRGDAAANFVASFQQRSAAAGLVVFVSTITGIVS